MIFYTSESLFLSTFFFFWTNSFFCLSSVYIFLLANKFMNTIFYHRLEGKVAIVTGGASGIGAETVKTFVENGAFVVIADINDELGHQVATSIGLDKVSYHHCDVSDEKQVEETVAFALEKYGTLDIMFSNAGIGGATAMSISILMM
ncbi:putative oxidoreductase [Medicago truncatula]|uniref:Putative oxidoreductase n=1 Tax=Medicago truncatula TaxID=3880 RepID=A0A396H8J9_MEDTR|nr:putative oxidoreductase [Medicago truncatula]